MIQLRKYQSEGIANIFSQWREGKRSVLFQMPTGTGKTTLFAEIIRKANDKNKKVLIIVHRIELVVQIFNRLQNFGIQAGLIVAGMQRLTTNVQIATIQTITNRELPYTDLIIVDEAHHSTADTYNKLIQNYPDAHILGVTATPIRMNGKGFENLFDCLIQSHQIKWFIENKYLAPVKQYVCSLPKIENIPTAMGDYKLELLNQAMTIKPELESLVTAYRNFAYNKKMIVFAVDIQHSKLIEQTYNDANIVCKHIDANTESKIRENILTGFKNGKINVITNVDIISEGFDVPDCEVVQLARPTKSIALYLQQAGRALRTAQNKEHAIILDNANCWKNHGLIVSDRVWKLTGSERKKVENVDFNYVEFDGEGVIRRKDESKILNTELIEVNEDLARCVFFEEYLQTALQRSYKPLFAYYKYKEMHNNKLTKSELEYIEQRINSLSNENKPKKQFWFYERKNLGII